MKMALQRKPRRNFEPSIGVMGVMRTVRCGFVAVLCRLVWAAPAAAADDVSSCSATTGAYTRARTAHCRTLRDARPAPEAVRGAVATAGKKRKTVIGELKRLRAAAQITPEDYAAPPRRLRGRKRRARRLRGARAAEMTPVAAPRSTDIAARRQLTRSAASRRCG